MIPVVVVISVLASYSTFNQGQQASVYWKLVRKAVAQRRFALGGNELNKEELNSCEKALQRKLKIPVENTCKGDL